MTQNQKIGKRKDHVTMNPVTFAAIIANLRRIVAHVGEHETVVQSNYNVEVIEEMLRAEVSFVNVYTASILKNCLYYSCSYSFTISRVVIA